MTGLAAVVAVQDKENAGYSGKAVFRQTGSTLRRALSNRSNLTPSRSECVSKATPAANKNIPQMSTSEVFQVDQLSARICQCSQQKGAEHSDDVCCDRHPVRLSLFCAKSAGRCICNSIYRSVLLCLLGKQHVLLQLCTRVHTCPKPGGLLYNVQSHNRMLLLQSLKTSVKDLPCCKYTSGRQSRFQDKATMRTVLF